MRKIEATGRECVSGGSRLGLRCLHYHRIPERGFQALRGQMAES